MTDKNKVSVIGEVRSDFQYNHEAFGEKFYLLELAVKRLSAREDIIPLLISERMMNLNPVKKGQMIHAEGQFRSYNLHDGIKGTVRLSIYVQSLRVVDTIEDSTKINNIYLTGYLCKEPIYRKTPLDREIADLLVAVNRPYGKSDYIPCITWGQNARYAMALKVGDRVSIWGRIQSREYVKKLSETHSETRVAYEVSVSKVDRGEE